MKVYEFYLVLSDNILASYPNDMVRNFNEVSSYLNELSILEDTSTDATIYMYAYTTNKKYAKRFRDTHDMSIFIEKHTTYSDSVYDKKCELMIMDDYRTRTDTSFNLLCTKYEKESMDDNFERFTHEVICDYVLYSYSILKDIYIESLDNLMYCTYHVLLLDDGDTMAYNMSYGLTAEGYPTNYINPIPNLLALYAKMFALLLWKGECK